MNYYYDNIGSKENKTHFLLNSVLQVEVKKITIIIAIFFLFLVLKIKHKPQL